MHYKKYVCLGSMIFLMACCLRYSDTALLYASEGLNLWFHKMLPALLPFMILSGVLIRMGLSDNFAKIFSLILQPVFRLSDSCIYTIVMGFLCGFPMGARVTAENLEQKRITDKEAELLLAFCNNIGPSYLLGFVFPYFHIKEINAWLCLFYLIPLLYGLFLRHTRYRSIRFHKNTDHISCSQMGFLKALQQSILSSLVSQASLGGYLIFFNLLKLPMEFLMELLLPMEFEPMKPFLYCFLEISGGIITLPAKQFAAAFICLQFGGLCCMAQTAAMIQDTRLKLKSYAIHKILLTVISVIVLSVI